MSYSLEPVSLEDALRIVDDTAEFGALEVERLPVRAALGRVLRADQTSVVDLPPFDKSAMDGYAIMAGDEREEYRLLETVPAGKVPTLPLSQGNATKVMTGTAVPEGAGKVIMIEYTEEHGDTVRVYRHGGRSNICLRGEDVHAGDVVMRAGTELSALGIANLISCGIAEVNVARAARVAVVSTGDEIVDSPERLGPGKIMNSNGPMLAGLVAEHGLALVSETSLPDEREATVAGVRAAIEAADVVVLSGGVSVGEFDFVLDAIIDTGLAVRFARVHAKPGKPTVYATSGRKVVFGLPGNPVAVYVMFHLLVMRAVRRLGGSTTEARRVSLPLAERFRRKVADRTEFVPCRVSSEGAIEQLDFHGSAHLMALSAADGFIIVPQGVGECEAGEMVPFMPTSSRVVRSAALAP